MRGMALKGLGKVGVPAGWWEVAVWRHGRLCSGVGTGKPARSHGTRQFRGSNLLHGIRLIRNTHASVFPRKLARRSGQP